MQSSSIIGLIAAALAILMAGEYYVLIHVDPLQTLHLQDKAALLLLKAVYKSGTFIRIGFIATYLIWLLSNFSASTHPQKRQRKRNWFTLCLLFTSFLTACLLLVTLQKQSVNFIAYLYPVAAFGVVIAGLLLASLLNLGRKQNFGIQNEKLKINTPYSFNYKTADGWINVVNPFRGIFITGGAGSGKSFSLANPTIHQAVCKGYCGLIYDFKFPVLAEEVNKALVLSGRKDTRHYMVNFFDLSRSHRLNPLKPENIPVVAYAEEYALAILNNLLPESIRRKDFWIRSANAILVAVIWFLKKHHPGQCSIPHVVNMILYKDYLHVMSMLETDAQCADMVRSALTAIENQAENQVAGVIGTLQMAIVRINTPEICWVLSGDDFDLELNNPSDPKFVTLGNHPTLSDTFSPVISCIATVALKLMNQPGKRHSLVLLDEAPTLYIPKLDMIPATARSNKVATIYMAQDFSQMVAHYGKEVADVVIANLNNQFYGRVGSASTAKHVSELFGREEKETQSISTGRSLHGDRQSNNQSLSRSLQERLVVRPQDITSLQVGEFIGMTVESKAPYFWSKIQAETFPEGDFSIPPFARGIMRQENFSRIKADVEGDNKKLREKGSEILADETRTIKR